jgi:hypothetical protein
MGLREGEVVEGLPAHRGGGPSRWRATAQGEKVGAYEEYGRQDVPRRGGYQQGPRGTRRGTAPGAAGGRGRVWWPASWARAPGVLSSESVAEQQQDFLHRSFVASRGTHQPSERPGLLGQQRAQIATDARRGLHGGSALESLAAVLEDVVQRIVQGVRSILS